MQGRFLLNVSITPMVHDQRTDVTTVYMTLDFFSCVGGAFWVACSAARASLNTRKDRLVERIAALFHRKPGTRPNPVKGFYTALAMFLPLIVLSMLGQSAFGGLVMFGALITSFGDVGTSSRMQARALGVTAVGGALMTGLGRLIGGPWWVELVEIFLVVFLGGLLGVYGRVAAGVGILLTIPLVLSLSNRGGPATALPSAAGFLLGGAILMLLALGFSRFQPQRSQAGNEAPASRARPTLTTFTTQLTWTSPLLRFALLRALGTAVAAGIGWLVGGPYPYWAALIVIACASPDQNTSLIMALQNIVATFLGALLADGVIADVQNALVFGLIVVAVTFLAFTVKELNYPLHVFFLTNLILLLASIGTPGHSFAALRVGAVLIGAGIVLVITFLGQMPFFERNVVPS